MSSHSYIENEKNANIYININGELFCRNEAKISVFDSGFLLGDGVWEGIRLHNNKLLFIDDNVDGIKTGFTKAAGYCLASSAKRGDRRLIAVVMGAPTPDVRIQASRTLLEYGFRFFETHTLFKPNTAISTARVYAGEETHVEFGVS